MIRWLEAAPATETFAPTKTLADIVPSVRPKMEALIAQARSWGMQPEIRSAGRTCAQQNEQKQLGYSQASMCRSLHTIGHAIDLNLSPNTCATYTKLGEWWEKQGGVWGGRWTQFGACGDAGHFHWYPGKAQAVPLSVCPNDVSLAECQALRERYLTEAFSRRNTGGGLLTGALMIAAGFGFVWATLRVKPGALKKNPTSFKEYTLYEHAAPGRNSWTIEAYFGNWRKAGEAEFVGVRDYSRDGELVGLKGWNVEVGADHRRKGLARAMYRYAEEVWGLPVYPGDFQTPMGEAFLGGR